MAGNPLQQANHFSRDGIPPIPLQPAHNHAPQNARVSREYRDIFLPKFLVCLWVSLFQALPASVSAAENGQSEGHWEDIHHPGGVADPGRPQDHYVMADYHRRMLDVSNFSLSGAGIPSNQ